MNGHAALLAVLTLAAAASLVLSSLVAVVIALRLTVLVNRLRMPPGQRVRYGWAGPLSMVALRGHPDAQVQRWARWLLPALVCAIASGAVTVTGMQVLGWPA